MLSTKSFVIEWLREEPVWKKINKTREQRMEKAANSRLLTGTERLEQLLAERLVPDSPLLQALVKLRICGKGDSMP